MEWLDEVRWWVTRRHDGSPRRQKWSGCWFAGG
ncbi:unnamed protein product [Chondrus crispus]|uniref:Uncharacterized protein n=1 Tax=Chondrus crispus TaxID=2769 RepID=R7QNW7_CHOCR|nr:unnamed protein product [Chondrus crispus]CDF39468.1 unnamed protein product [Chondrus crispus]|eukprot:XP_005719379.1 unnamed protein product [Chondrus crispus]